MIAKSEVRKRLALYEQKIREEKKLIEEEMNKMKNACSTIEMQTIWKQSREYTKLSAIWETLNEVLLDVKDIRCEEMLNDY